ncbi:MAG: ROK family transcriptional regulator [Candidatus Devosia phytovorans]|uniref:ROK family transcriptional regulator n=1 Tax=Candidatus Devosia phytovorans TaxID=3121372 RepID=A0AAJ6B057_9HYPH|nr:ROK family transcriptional regulator [Devosia sp.]WEK03143.1 MAG: ROK family transcriptional regulator [Devosia sp.]
MNEPGARGFAQSGVRVANERAVLTLVAVNPGSSNADLARLSGLGPQTTSRILAELESRDLVMRGEPLRGRRGQPATPLFINPDGACVIGVEIGWRSLEVMLLSMTGQTLASISRSHDLLDADTIFADIAAEIATIRAGLTQRQSDRLIGIGVCISRNIEQGLEALGASARQIARWSSLDITAHLQGLTGLETSSISDGSAASWSEWLALPRPWPASFACLYVGAFLGSGILINGSLWESRSSNGASLGDIIVPDASGKPTSVQDIASLLVLQRRCEAAGLKLPDSRSTRWDWSALGAVGEAWLEDAARALAVAVLNTSAVIEVELIVIDGILPRDVMARLVERVEHHLGLMPYSRPVPALALGKLGASAAANGVAQMLLFRRFFARAWDLFVT